MLKLLRIDNRLIHGQVAFSSVSAYKIKKIVVANNHYATDSMLKMTLTLGKPAGIKMDIFTIPDALLYLNDPTKKLDEVMVVVSNVEDAHELAMKSEVVREVCIGGVVNGDNKKLVHSQVFLSPEEIDLIHEIVNKKIVVYAQDIPANKKVFAEEFFNKF